MNTQKIKAILLISSILLQGCILLPENKELNKVPDLIEQEMMEDLVTQIRERFPPAKTKLSLPESERNKSLDEHLRATGYAVHQTGDVNIVRFTAHYMPIGDTYLGTMRVGLAYTVTKSYLYDAGKLETVAISVADDSAGTQNE